VEKTVKFILNRANRTSNIGGRAPLLQIQSNGIRTRGEEGRKIGRARDMKANETPAKENKRPPGEKSLSGPHLIDSRPIALQSAVTRGVAESRVKEGVTKR